MQTAMAQWERLGVGKILTTVFTKSKCTALSSTLGAAFIISFVALNRRFPQTPFVESTHRCYMTRCIKVTGLLPKSIINKNNDLMSKNTESMPSIHRQNITVLFYLDKYPCCRHTAAVSVCNLYTVSTRWTLDDSSVTSNQEQRGSGTCQHTKTVTSCFENSTGWAVSPSQNPVFSFQYCLKCKTQASVSKKVHGADGKATTAPPRHR